MTFPPAVSNGLDWESLGLVLCLLGCFLLGNGVLLRDPRSLLAQRLARATPPLRTLRELVFQRVQTGLAGIVGRHIGNDAKRRNGAHGDNVAGVARDHVGQHGTSNTHCPGQIGFDDRRPVVR